MQMAGVDWWMFRVDVASETKVVLDAFLSVVGGAIGGLCGGEPDCHFVASLAFLDVDSGSGSLVCFQELQEMGNEQV
jgi:hypothetical protein